jgi:hypothetical protein
MRHAFCLFASLPLLVAAERPPAYAVGDRGFAALQDAVDAIGEGEGVITVAPGSHRDCAVQAGGRVTYRAAQPGTAIFDGGACEGKATLVLRGRGSSVEGLVFRNVQVPDGNGAGIRIEAGDLIVADAMFLDSQEGILGAQEAAQTVRIDRSTFAGLGQCETTDCAHAVYLANRGQVTITNSRFERGTGGHYVKLRTPRVTIAGNSFDDTAGRKTNYMIDLSNGGTGVIAGNTFVQGRDKENWSALIVVAAEGRTYPSTGLRLENNDARLSPGETRSPAFVADLSHQRLAIAGNRLGAGLRGFEQR